MKGTYLRFYVQENKKHHHLLAYEWLLEQARKMGLPGGSAFKAMAGFGRHGMLHEDHFFELAGHLPVVVEFILSQEDADRFLTFLQAEELTLFYLSLPVEFSTIKGVSI
jgi:PII-like signaling protein